MPGVCKYIVYGYVLLSRLGHIVMRIETTTCAEKKNLYSVYIFYKITLFYGCLSAPSFANFLEITKAVIKCSTVLFIFMTTHNRIYCDYSNLGHSLDW